MLLSPPQKHLSIVSHWSLPPAGRCRQDPVACESHLPIDRVAKRHHWRGKLVSVVGTNCSPASRLQWVSFTKAVINWPIFSMPALRSLALQQSCIWPKRKPLLEAPWDAAWKVWVACFSHLDGSSPGTLLVPLRASGIRNLLGFPLPTIMGCVTDDNTCVFNVLLLPVLPPGPFLSMAKGKKFIQSFPLGRELPFLGSAGPQALA